MKTKVEINQSVLEHAIDGLVNVNEGIYGADLHNELFNMDYFIIGRYQAEQWLIANGGVFNAIETIKDYEQDNFGSVNTDFSEPEKVCNMYVYILGEELLQESKVLQDKWNDTLSQKDLNKIKKELESLR